MLVCEQLEASGLDVTFQLQQLLLSVAEEQADGSIIYSDAIVDAGALVFHVFFLYSRRLSARYCFLAHSLFFSPAIRIHGHGGSLEGFGRVSATIRDVVEQ